MFENTESQMREQLVEGFMMQEEAAALFLNFRGFEDPGYDKKAYEILFERMVEFEETTIAFDIMPVFYGYIARVALNAGHSDTAVKYALAGRKLCIDDPQGLTTYNNILCDTALVMDSTKVASEFYAKAQNTTDIPFSVTENEAHDIAVREFMSNSEREPQSMGAVRKRMGM